jgi:hypothetical protein
MEIENIKFHIDRGISIRCKQSGGKELQKFTPEHLRSAIVNYDISLIHDPLKKVKETCRIDNRNIECKSTNFTLFFPLENIIEPNESQITFRSLVFLLNNKSKISHPLNETYSFIELQKNSMEHSIYTTEGMNQGQKDENLQEGKHFQSGNTPSPGIPPRINTITATKEELKHLFEDSYHKFLKDFQTSQVQDMVTSKQSTLDFNMKNFGISLLCKLLLLVKYFNVLVDNDFQGDLNTFLQQNLLDTKKLEGLV